MWRISLLGGCLLVFCATLADADLPSVRPEARPDRLPNGRIIQRPAPRPVIEAPPPWKMRPLPRPARNASVEIAAIVRPLPRPETHRVKPIGLPMPDRIPTAAAPLNHDVVMIGDSITAGGNWSRQFPGLKIANKGVPSDTSAMILNRMGDILATNPNVALVMFGINDIYNDVPVTRIVRRYEAVVDRLSAHGIKVVVQSTLDCSAAVCGARLARVHDLNTALRAMAGSRGLAFVDINRTLSGKQGLRAEYSRDGVHLNGAGYARWYKALTPYIWRS